MRTVRIIALFVLMWLLVLAAYTEPDLQGKCALSVTSIFAAFFFCKDAGVFDKR